MPETPHMRNENFRKAVDRNLDLIESLSVLAGEHGKPLSHLAYAFLYHQPHVGSVIVGPRTVEHVSEALAALEWKLPAEVMQRIDELVPQGSAPDYIGW